MGLSKDPEKRARQLANLRPGAGAWKPGAAPNMKHGLRTRRPDRVLLADAASEVIDALEAQVPLKGADGLPLPEFTAAVEAAALQLVVIRRTLAFLHNHGWEDGRGRMRPEVEGLERALNRLRRHLDGLGATPASYARLGFDVARTDEVMRDAAERDAGRLTDAELDAALTGVDDLAASGRTNRRRLRQKPQTAADETSAPATARSPIDDLRDSVAAALNPPEED